MTTNRLRPAGRDWKLEDLLDRPGARGMAEAAARFAGDLSARRALDDLHAAVRYLETHADELEVPHDAAGV